MDLGPAIDAIWNSTRQGVYYPAEWKGRLSVEDGYRVQLGLLERHIAEGAIHAGWKVGLTAKAIQDQIGFHEPVFGFLLDTGHVPSGAAISCDDLLAASFETELCLTVGHSLRGTGVDLPAARAAISGVAPAFEIVERRGDFAADHGLAMADNVQQKFFVTGEPATDAGMAARLSGCQVEIFINGERVDRAPGSNVMGDPAASVAWLANKLAEFDWTLEQGMRIMSGSFTRQFPIAQGDVIEAKFDVFGNVTAEFR